MQPALTRVTACVLLITCHFHLGSIKCLQVTLVYASPRTMTRGPTCHRAPVCINADRAAQVAGYQLWRHVLLPLSFHRWWGLDFVGSYPQPGNPGCQVRRGSGISFTDTHAGCPQPRATQLPPSQKCVTVLTTGLHQRPGALSGY